MERKRSLKYASLAAWLEREQTSGRSKSRLAPHIGRHKGKESYLLKCVSKHAF